MVKSGVNRQRAAVLITLLVLLIGQVVWLSLGRSPTSGTSLDESPDFVVDLRGYTLQLPQMRQLRSLSDASLTEQLEAPRVVVAFLHPSCPACVAARPVLKQIVADGEGQTGFIGVFAGTQDEIVDYAGSLPAFVDEGRELSVELGVSSVPAFLVVRDGLIKFQFVGWSDDIARELVLATRVDLTGQGIERHAGGTRAL